MQLLEASRVAWELAGAVVQEGGLAACPTDTVYGLGCDPYNVAAIQRIYAAKGRELGKAIPLLLSNVGRAEAVAVAFSDPARALGRRFWPGALTLVVWRRPGLPSELGGGETVALRVPAHSELRRFIELCGGALAVTSANLSGQPDSLTAEQVVRGLGEAVDLILDGGPSGGGVPSTVVDCTRKPPAVLREGAISEARIRQTLVERAGGAN